MDNFDDVSLAIETLKNRADMLETFIAKLLAKLLENEHIKPAELIEILIALEKESPYDHAAHAQTFDNTSLRYLCKFIFAELPSLETTNFSRYYKDRPELKDPQYDRHRSE